MHVFLTWAEAAALLDTTELEAIREAKRQGWAWKRAGPLVQPESVARLRDVIVEHGRKMDGRRVRTRTHAA